MDDRKFLTFDPRAEVRIRWRNLPHWEQDGCSYFVTFRCADSVPARLLDQWRKERDDWLRQHPKPRTANDVRDFHRRFTSRIYRWLDGCMGECVLARSEVADLMNSALSFFDGDRYILDRYVVMPNHVHLILKPLFCEREREFFPLDGILQSIKSYTSKKINKICERTGKFWQREYFDHILRGYRHLEFYRRYIEENPGKAGISAEQVKLGRGRGLV